MKRKVFHNYEEVVKELFPKDWKNRHKVCIYCHQEIKNKDKFQQLPQEKIK